jgi:putative restriction endonuclease
VWNDVAHTRGIGDANSVTVGVLHTGRHYPGDLSDAALLYHYPETNRPAGRDRSEIEATRAAGRLRIPVFVILQEGTRRTVRKGWVATWDDEEQLFLIEFGSLPVRVPRGDNVDSDPFALFEDRQEVFRKTRGRPNQQRFKMQVVQRYGGCCVLCDSAVTEWLHAAHLAGDAESGSSDPRNGLPLCSNHHTAFDRGLISVDPSDGRVYLRGYSAADLDITRADLAHLPAQPAAEALWYRWKKREPEGWSLAL